jgi:SPP1 gp7 family putative phage head morphogenesis protein
MCEVCEHITVNAKRQYDPTHTTTLRNLMVRESNRRFNTLTALINKAVVGEDVFGLTVMQSTPGRNAFAFLSDDKKIQEFLIWLEQLVNDDILEIYGIPQGSNLRNWLDKYLRDAYSRGIARAREELRKAGYSVPTITSSGGLASIMSAAIHVDALALLYTRVFNELKGVTDAMHQHISRILAEGFMSGANPRVLARRMIAAINGSGAGDLGMTDTLGRFIPARRRAEIIARTEIIRAHHYANINEYMTWGVGNLTVRAEWQTAGDSRVCSICQSLEGQVFTLEEILPLIPVHPMCFIDPQTPIYTSEGWKPIGKIKVGDLVLTHKKRFRKVTALIRTPDQLPEVTKFTFDSGKTLTVTDNHPVLRTVKDGKRGRWKDAKDIKVGDHLMFLGNTCKRCGKAIPYFQKYCSHSCNSKDITDKQWADPEHRKNVSEKNRVSMLKQYKYGLRDKDTITKNANEKVRQLVKDGEWGNWMDEAFFEKIKKVTNLPEHRAASSKRMKENNPIYIPEIKEKARISLVKTLEKNPELRINMRMAQFRKSNRKTRIEQKMADLLDKIGVDYTFQHPILRYNVDFAIPSLRIVIECDGEYWHRDKKSDLIRQRRIEKEGWFVLRYSDKKIDLCMDEIQDELLRVVGNHTGEYSTVGWKVKAIERWKLKKKRMLYNFSVEEDESYIAKGVVVHNCRCIALPIVKTKIGGN